MQANVEFSEIEVEDVVFFFCDFFLFKDGRGLRVAWEMAGDDDE